MKIVIRAIICFLVLGLATSLEAEQVGLIPVPVLKDVKVYCQVTFDPASGLFTYAYTFVNPATNTGKIWYIAFTILQPPNGQVLSSEGLTIPIGLQTKTFDEEFNRESFQALNPMPVVPVGQRVPPGWDGGIGAGGFASFGSADSLIKGSDMILPGETRGGFELISQGLPTIRENEIVPDWVFLVESEETVTPEEDQQAREVEEKIRFYTKSLGPTAPPRFFDHKAFVDTLQGYLDQSISLGWLPDLTFINTLRTELNTASSYLDANDPSSAKIALQRFMDAIDQATLAQQTPEAQALLYYNAKYLKDTLPETYVPPVFRLDLIPQEATLPIGTIHTLTATFKIDDTPLPDYLIILEVTLGPNKGLVLEEFSDANGKATFRYTSKVTGTDELVAQVPSWVESIDNALIASLPARVTWTGGPDLVIELFIPPVIKTEGGRPVSITEITGNHGNTTAGHSITRYYISTDPIIDPYDDRPIGERAIPSLEPWTSSIGSLKVLLPDDLPAGTYYVGACADADQAVIELDEQNNCVVNQLAIALEPVQNQPPDCTQARPSSDILWPPNHKLVSITILGVSDPDGDQIAITITKITQDEPVNGLGDGDTIPDGFVIGTSEAKVRAERSGIGNGRVYVISFIAEDSKGGTCTGKVQVGVPHDQGKSKIPIDDGQVYDSTLP